MTRQRQLTVGELIDYLEQFSRSASVYLEERDVPMSIDHDFIALDMIEYVIDQERQAA